LTDNSQSLPVVSPGSWYDIYWIWSVCKHHILFFILSVATARHCVGCLAPGTFYHSTQYWKFWVFSLCARIPLCL